MYIGKLAELTGATPKATRLYGAIGLMPAPLRQGTCRVYSGTDGVLINMIRRAKAAGFNLVELKELVALKAQGKRFPIEVAQALVANKKEKLRKDIADLRSVEQSLKSLERDLDWNFGPTLLGIQDNAQHGA